MSKYKIHPIALTYPPMTDAELDALAADIAERGLQRPIVLYEGMILDGRNRYEACDRANVEPAFVNYEGDDPLGQVNSLNLNRDLTSAQRAVIAAHQWLLNGDTKDRGKGRRSKPDEVKTLPHGLDYFVKHFRSSKPTILQARDLLDEAPDLADRVWLSTMSLAAAHEKLQEKKKEEAKDKKNKERVSKYLEAISNGELTMQQALEKVMEEEREEEETRKSQASARRLFLEGLVNTVKWIEQSIAPRTDEYLAWYTEPDSPGLFDHGVTSDRVSAAIKELERICTFALGERHDGNGESSSHAKTGKKGRAKASP